MNEIGLGIITDAAFGDSKRDVPHTRRGEAGQTNVDRLAAHMEAIRSDLVTPRRKHGIGRRRPISGDDADGLVEFDAVGHLMKNVEQRRIDRFDAARSKVPQMITDLGKTFRKVRAIAPVNSRQRFEGMKIV